MLLSPGVLSPLRSVPATSRGPEYVGARPPAPFTGSEVKDAEIIEAMRVAGRIAAQALAEVGRHVAPGVTTDELDRVGHEFLSTMARIPRRSATRAFPKSLCTSVNEVICHGIPDSTVLEDGDIVNVDITAFIGGVHGDTDATFLVGDVDEESRLLVERTHEAMMRGINAVAPGRQVNVIGRVIESYARRFGYGVVRDFTGHGVGQAFHSGLVIPHYDEADGDDGHGDRHDVHDRADADARQHRLRRSGPTAGRSLPRTGRRTAQFEHTVLVTESGAEILTLP